MNILDERKIQIEEMYKQAVKYKDEQLFKYAEGKEFQYEMELLDQMYGIPNGPELD